MKTLIFALLIDGIIVGWTYIISIVMERANYSGPYIFWMVCAIITLIYGTKRILDLAITKE